MAKKKKSTKKTVVKTLAQVAAHPKIKVSERVVHTWRRRNPPMPGKSGNYVIEDIVNWRQIHVQKPPKERKGSPDDPQAKRIRQIEVETKETELVVKRERAKQARIKTMREDSEFVEVAKVNQFIAEFLAEVRDKATRIPKDMCAAYPKDVYDLVFPDLEKRVELMLHEVGDWLDRTDELQKD